MAHIALPPVTAEEVQAVLASQGYATRMATLPACADALRKEGTLAPLITRYGPAATMCVNEPMLEAKSHSKTNGIDTLSHYLANVKTVRRP